jgi:hypothetical protein
VHFAIDGAKAGKYIPVNLTSVIYHEALWMSPTLASGSHVLEITQSSAQSSPVIYLDYLMYTTSSAAVNEYFIDDRDSRLTYSPPWRDGGSEAEVQHTTRGSTAAGDKLSFTFKGK